MVPLVRFFQAPFSIRKSQFATMATDKPDIPQDESEDDMVCEQFIPFRSYINDFYWFCCIIAHSVSRKNPGLR